MGVSLTWLALSVKDDPTRSLCSRKTRDFRFPPPNRGGFCKFPWICRNHLLSIGLRNNTFVSHPWLFPLKNTKKFSDFFQILCPTNTMKTNGKFVNFGRLGVYFPQNTTSWGTSGAKWGFFRFSARKCRKILQELSNGKKLPLFSREKFFTRQKAWGKDHRQKIAAKKTRMFLPHGCPQKITQQKSGTPAPSGGIG